MTGCPERGEIDRFPERGPKVIDFHTPAHSHGEKRDRAARSPTITSLVVGVVSSSSYRANPIDSPPPL